MATLNLPKTELIARLEARKDEIRAEYKTAEESVAQELARRKGAIADSEAQADWYEELAKGLREGRFELTDSGKLRAVSRNDIVPAKPGTKNSAVTTMKGIRGAEPQFAYYDSSRLEEMVKSWVGMLADELKPIDSAIDLLNLATDEVVEVNSDDYSGLLNGSTTRRRHFF